VVGAMRVRSPLDPGTELVMTRTIGAALAVHKALGPGFLESIYRKAMCIELESYAIPFERERSIRVRYRNVEIRGQRVDLVVADAVIVELKSVAKFDEIHRSQLISYLKTMGLRGGLLINFRVTRLKDGLIRVVL
jgi:GxxExxY protein